MAGDKESEYLLPLDSKNPLPMPIQCNHLLQGFVYNNISDHDYRSFLHEEGYILNNRRFKLFTFSRLEGQFKVERESLFSSTLHFAW